MPRFFIDPLSPWTQFPPLLSCITGYSNVTSVTVAEVILTHYYWQKPTVYIRAHCSCCWCCGFWQMHDVIIHHYGIIQNSSPAYPTPSEFYLFIPSSLATEPLATTSLFTVLLVLLFQNEQAPLLGAFFIPIIPEGALCSSGPPSQDKVTSHLLMHPLPFFLHGCGFLWS